MKALFSCITLTLLLLISWSNGYAGWAPLNHNGGTISFEDRPLIISTWEGLRGVVNKDPNMLSPEYTTGFIHYAAVDDEMFLSSGIGFSSNEARLAGQSRSYLEMVRASGESLSFNGRVILIAHGSPEGDIEFEFGGERIEAKKATDVASHLTDFFEKYKIKVDRLDLFVCCEGRTTMVDQFVTIYREKGLDIKIVGFESKIGAANFHDSGDREWFYILDDTGIAHSIPLSDFLLKGRLPSPREAQLKIVTHVIGTPPDTPAPVIPAPGGACEDAPSLHRSLIRSRYLSNG